MSALLHDPVQEDLIIERFKAREKKLAMLRDIGRPKFKVNSIMVLGLIYALGGMFLFNHLHDNSGVSILLIALGISWINGSSNDADERIRKLTDLMIEEIETQKLIDSGHGSAKES